MAIQFSTTYRNLLLDQFETHVGEAPKLKILSGSPPANCAAVETGDVLATLTLPTDWMGAANAGAKAKSGTWEDASADAAGTAGYFRIYDNAGTTCHMQGTITITGGGGDMTLVNTNIAAGQPITITGFTLTAPGA